MAETDQLVKEFQQEVDVEMSQDDHYSSDLDRHEA